MRVTNLYNELEPYIRPRTSIYWQGLQQFDVTALTLAAAAMSSTEKTESVEAEPEGDAMQLFSQGMKFIRDVNPEIHKKAIPYFKAAYKQQHNRAAIQLFFCYRHGFGVDKDQEKAREYLEGTHKWKCFKDNQYAQLGFPSLLSPPESASAESKCEKAQMPEGGDQPEPDMFEARAKQALRRVRKKAKSKTKKKEMWKFP